MTNIYVGNLDFGATEEQLRQLFSTYGPVEKISLITDRDTGQPRGFGFVEMSNSADAQKAIAGLNGSKLGDRNITVNEARPKKEAAGGGFGGGRGRSRDGGGYRGGRGRY